MVETETIGNLLQKNWGKIWFSVGLMGGIAVMKYGPRIPEIIGKGLGKSVSEHLQNSDYLNPEIKKLYLMVNDLSKKFDDLYKRFDKNE